MSSLIWNEGLRLGQPRLDATHVEFVELLDGFDAAIDGGEPAEALAALLAHTVAHFALEERWMASLGFDAQNCHAFQHQAVLNVLREVQRLHAAAPDPALLRRLAAELALWFPAHAQTMDAALVQTMAERGYDPETGTLRRPREPEEALITGCGGSSCG